MGRRAAQLENFKPPPESMAAALCLLAVLAVVVRSQIQSNPCYAHTCIGTRVLPPHGCGCIDTGAPAFALFPPATPRREHDMGLLRGHYHLLHHPRHCHVARRQAAQVGCSKCHQSIRPLAPAYFPLHSADSHRRLVVFNADQNLALDERAQQRFADSAIDSMLTEERQRRLSAIIQACRRISILGPLQMHVGRAVR